MKNLNNKVQLIGNLGADPEVKELNGNKRMGIVQKFLNQRMLDYFPNNALIVK